MPEVSTAVLIKMLKFDINGVTGKNIGKVYFAERKKVIIIR